MKKICAKKNKCSQIGDGGSDATKLFYSYRQKLLMGCHRSTTGKPVYSFIFASMMNGRDDLQTRWWTLEAKLLERFGKKPDMEAILFLIGLNETGFMQEKITKEQKQDLMHVAVCTLLSESGYFVLEGTDDEGWPHFKQLKEMPQLHVFEQEQFLKDHILLYFQKNEF